jgi:hypothetical protein
MSTATKTKLADAIRQFAAGDPGANSIHLFKILGYNTTRSLYLSKSDYATFRDELSITAASGFNEKNALVSEWESVHLLFQLTAEEMKPQVPMFEPTLNREDPASFLFFTIRLKGNHYSRSQLAAIARELNKPFAMDVFVLFQFGDFLTFSLIERRPNKKVLDRDVVSKVTHIYNICIAKPHAAHIQILFTFSFEAIERESRKKRIQNFKELQLGWKKVVSTQVLNTQFYRDYQELSKKLIKSIATQQPNKMLAHQGILNLLNRIMFIYFVQKKGWLMADDNFIYHYWQAYLNEGLNGKDRFHKHWLNTVFFTAFNGQALRNGKALAVLAEPYNQELFHFPYLNGGLFTYNKELDDFELSDKHFHDIFHFFESYIFTISEDTPYDVNLEINPELLGKMYEGMINATDLDDVDAEHGIVYTERPEINFMVRRSLVEVLDKKLNGSMPREVLYHLVFDTIEEKQPWLQQYKNQLPQLRQAICSLTACDPSCGSGSMLLGVIQVQMEMLRSIDAFLGNPHTPKDDFKIKKQLISDCIYGVDIKEWAVRIAELRLWLYMISEAEFTQPELQKEPLLPNLDFKLRCGNSLLQKFGELDFTIEDLFKGRKKNTGAAKNLNNYIKKKKAFIQNQAASGTTYENLKAEEKAVFLDMIREMITEKEQQIHNRKVRLKQGLLFPGETKDDSDDGEIEQYETESAQLKALRKQIFKEKRLPFSYDIDFMEVFVAKEDDDDKGFDLVIGNPPYVKEADILPPEDPNYLEYLMERGDDGKLLHEAEKADANELLKSMLNGKVYSKYPFLNTEIVKQINSNKSNLPVYGKKVPGKTDLYGYFQLICPSLTNSKGILCFIISNSWMDVDFGSYIQHFFLKHIRLLNIYDCSVRSFDAAINTIIYLHGSPENFPNFKGKDKKFSVVDPLLNDVSFIKFHLDYSNAAYSNLLIGLEQEKGFSSNDIYKAFVISQKELYKIGLNDDGISYNGDKWYGLYFKSSEIFHKINSNPNCTLLANHGRIKLGITSCQNKYFYLEDEKIKEYGIDEKYLKRILKSPQECYSIQVDETNLRFSVLNVKDRFDEITSSGLKTYIHFGEASKVNKVKCLLGRSLWYNIGELEVAHVIIPYSYGDSFKTYYSDSGICCDKRLVMFFPKEPELAKQIALILNSTVWFLFIEVYGSTNLGEGALVFNTNNFRRMKIPFFGIIWEDLKIDFHSFFARIQNDIFQETGLDSNFPIRSQIPNPLPDRAALDKVVFDAIGLTED